MRWSGRSKQSRPPTKPPGRAARTWSVETVLARIRRAPSVLDVIPLVGLLAAEVAEAADGKGGQPPFGDELLEAAGDTSDAPTAIAAVHALARLPGAAIDDALAGILAGGGWLAPHAAWSLADRAPAQQLIDPLVALLEDGRLGGMLAQQTLARWAAVAPRAIWTALERRLWRAGAAGARGRLVETLGLVAPVGSPDAAERLLARIAVDEDEQHEARVAAIAALGDRPGAAARALAALVISDGPLADVARLALLDHRLAAAPAAGPAGGLHVAQVHLGGQLDRALAHAGQGSTGGIATLLVQLGDALVADGRVEAVTTIGRGTARDAAASLGLSMDPHAVLAAPLGRHEDAAFAGEWPALVAAERAIRRIVARRTPTLLHLRMADVGSLAASRIARRAGMPTVFTLAPDPHAVIAEMERSGELDRASFGPADAAGALWFRARLVRHLADSARQIVLFPRSDLEARLRDLLRIDVHADPGRYHVVPEGIDPQPVRAARSEVAPAREPGGGRGPARRRRGPGRRPARPAAGGQRRPAGRCERHGAPRRGLRGRARATAASQSRDRRRGPRQSHARGAGRDRPYRSGPGPASGDGRSARDAGPPAPRRRPAGPGCSRGGTRADDRTGRCVRLRQPQGGVRARAPRGARGRPAGRRSPDGRPAVLRRGRGDRAAG